MKILHVIDSADPSAGGPVEAIRNLVDAHEARGHEVSVVTLDPPTAPWLQTTAGTWHGLGGNAGGFAFSRTLASWLRKNRATYDIVIINGLWKFPGLAVWWTLRGNCPYLVYPHGMLDPWFKTHYPAKHLKKAIYWALFENHVIRDAAAVCFTCEEERLLARDTFRPYRCTERVVGLGIVSPPEDVATQCAAFDGEYPALTKKPFLLFLSRLHEKKGVDLLLRGYAALTKSDSKNVAPLVIAGPPFSEAYLAELKSLARSLGLEIGNGKDVPGGSAPVVHFLPMLRGDLKWGAFRRSEAFVLPSHQENFGIAVVEALACAKPVLISNKVNIWREIESDAAGLVEADTEEGTLKMLSRWTLLSPVDKSGMAENAVKCFRQRFHIDAAADTLLELIREVAPARTAILPS
ncbi:MAG TPA: glycosyltransferase [Chthoniobacterales bacterium]